MTATTYQPQRNGSATDKSAAASAVLAGAAGFGLGLLASVGRRAAVQAPTAMAGDWFEGLKAEHKMARALFEKLGASSDDGKAARAALLAQLQHALGKHNVEEEYVVYCVLREHGQTDDADGLHAEHGQLKQALFDLEMIGKRQQPGFLARLAEAREAFEAHVRKEEDDIFPRLRASLDAEQARLVTSRMNREGFKVA